ncbi:hypothetical protein KZR47_000991 [Enterococcus faecalis]|uniref:hypothetical protein n=1 Tax=Enterococcus faecalis TaxID=1351 RepID=UPI0001F0C73A|nr:hypothetical protein [Enterococcus faecalis]EFT95170.1 hypothetical protein HMPREF9499_00613 [Enterococcus faecalis TX0012]EHU8539410.1 hypothetical protein [Enterococcus faecalis]
MSLTNFSKPISQEDRKRIYFTTGNRMYLHVLGCMGISTKEKEEQIKKEVDAAQSTIKKTGIIRMVHSPKRVIASIEAETQEESSKSGQNSTEKNGNNGKVKKEARNIYSVASFVELYNREDIDNSQYNIQVGSEILSLEELFLNARNTAASNKIRIYQGIGKITTASFRDTVLEVKFSDFQEKSIFTNKKMIMRQNLKTVTSYCDSDEELQIYFRGYYGSKKGKMCFLPFHEGQVYKDLYFKTISDK